MISIQTFHPSTNCADYQPRLVTLSKPQNEAEMSRVWERKESSVQQHPFGGCFDSDDQYRWATIGLASL